MLEKQKTIQTFFIFFLTFFLLLFLSRFNDSSRPPSNNLDPLHSFVIPTSTRRLQNERNPTLRRVPHNPLDPLTVAEINTAREILSSHFSINRSSLHALHSIVLEEPDKSLVYTWIRNSSVQPFMERKAAVLALLHGKTHSITVDLRAKMVTRLEIITSSGYPGLTDEDVTVALSVPLANADFNRTIVERGVDLADLVCLPLSCGLFNKDEVKNARVIKIQCYSKQGTVNFYMRPIEGLTALVNLDTKQVINITDHGRSVPIPNAANTDYRHSTLKPAQQPHPNPIFMEQPMGRSFSISHNHMVKWGNWEFHVRPDPRAGVILSQARIRDPVNGRIRSVLYKGMVSELFVPYMDPTEGWFFKTYMDAGEYGMGIQAMPLEPLNDCPRDAHYMDGVFAASDGRAYVRSRMVCVFERYGGEIGWRHAEAVIKSMGVREVRPKVTLVVRMVASVANYDYIIDWEFQTDGLIRVKVGLSGILMVKGTSYSHTSEVPENESLYGTLLSENVIGVIHDHYVTLYLDMDVDGTENSFQKVHLRREADLMGKFPRKSYLKAMKNIARTEKEARVKLSLYSPTEYHIINPGKETRMGNPVGYKVTGGMTAANLMDPDDPAEKRGAFTENQMWVSPYERREEWAGGLLAYGNEGDDTLAAWSEKDRGIADRDIVVWYTVGFHHVPSQEDFPVMPTVTGSVDLKPANFFERNPILNAAPYTEADLPVCKATGPAVAL